MTESGYQDREQSKLKHHAIKLYLEAATRILGSSWDFKYVDCCAGPWESRETNSSDTSFGIVIDILRRARIDFSKRNKSPRFACLLIEKKEDSFSKLDAFAKANTSDSIRIDARNWDFTEHISDIARYCSRPRTFPFLLIDPWGWKLAGISQISPLLKLEQCEVVINFMSSFVTRFVKTTDFSDLLGTDYPELRGLNGSELEFAVVRKYCELIKREGQFAYVCALPVMKPDSDSFNFHLIYATRHPKGVEVFKNVEKRTEEKTRFVRADLPQRQRQARTQNLELYDASVQYRERRYQQLAIENRERARQQVWELLQTKRQIRYADCWAEALQYSAVYEPDLRSWISGWEKAGSVTVSGRKFPTEVLKRESPHHQLTYQGSQIVF